MPHKVMVLRSVAVSYCEEMIDADCDVVPDKLHDAIHAALMEVPGVFRVESSEGEPFIQDEIPDVQGGR